MLAMREGITAPDRYSGRIITGIADLHAISGAWQDLHRASGGTPFSDMDWILAWADTFWTEDVAVRVVTVWDGDQLVAALPLRLDRARVSRRLPFRTQALSMLFDDRVGSHDVLLRPGHGGAANLMADLCRQTGAAYMDLTPLAPSEGLDALRVALGCHWRHERVEILSAIADLEGGWDGYLARRSSNTRKGLRKIERKLGEAQARITSARFGDPEAEATLQAVFSVSGRSWKARGGTDIGSQDRDRAFIRGVFSQLGERSATDLHVLWLANEPVAACIILTCDGTAYGLVTDYDDAHAKAGVGRHITAHAIAKARADGCARFDMLRKTPFTQTFADQESGLMRLRVALRPGLARWIVSGEFAARALVERVAGEKTRLTGRRKIIGERG